MAITKQSLFNQIRINLYPYQKQFMSIVEGDQDGKRLFFLRTSRGSGKTTYLIAESIKQAFLLNQNVLFVTLHSQERKRVLQDIQDCVKTGGLAVRFMSNEIRFDPNGGTIEVLTAQELKNFSTGRHGKKSVVMIDEFGEIDEQYPAAFDMIMTIADEKVLTTTEMLGRSTSIWNDLEHNKLQVPDNFKKTHVVTDVSDVGKEPKINVVTDVSADRMIESVIKESIEQGRPVAMSEIWVSEFTIGVDVATGEDNSAVFQMGTTGFASTEVVDPGNTPIFFHDGIESRFSPSSNNPLAHALIHGIGD